MTFLQDFPISALAICYGPLALMIIGFIGFALLTDADATATYLRRMDPRPEDEQKARDFISISKAQATRTPSGAPVSLRPQLPEGEKGKVITSVDASQIEAGEDEA